jgi:LPPG:FO 2-phospho-L-lactate transferase
MKIAAFAGGVGGAKLADGLVQNLPPEDLTVIVNIGDDFEHFGLKVCPDLDTVCYTLAGIANPETGWGRVGERWEAMESAERLGAPSWFRLGDRDLGTHLERTRRLRAGDALSQITREFCAAWGAGPTVLPASDDDIPTIVETDEGEMTFQEYFVARRCVPPVTGFRFAGAEKAHPAPGVIEAIEAADTVVICPSNPWVSIDPILAIPGVRDALAAKAVIAVSPLIGGKAVKGPAAKMYQELGIVPSAEAVANHYGALLAGFVLDNVDAVQAKRVQSLGIAPFVAETLMHSRGDRKRLAGEALAFAVELTKQRRGAVA